MPSTVRTTSASPPDAAVSADMPEGPSRARRTHLDSAPEVEVAHDVAIAFNRDWLAANLAVAAEQVAATAARRIARLSVVITGDRAIIDLNRRHFGKDATTDVISFDASNNGAIAADIAVNADEAGRRAAEYGHSVEREMLLYALHGLLHCAGFDDQTDTGYSAMHGEEDRILAAIGVGATFRPPPPEGTEEGGR